MKPLSKKRRVWSIVVLVLIFCVVAPVLIMYARGYRLDNAFKVVTTGGIYVSAPQSGTEIYIDDKLEKTTSIFQKSVFVQNLIPGVYNIRVHKDSYQEWRKTLHVFPETVTEARSFIFPINPVVTEISQKIAAQVVNGQIATSGVASKTVINPEYMAVSLLFSAPKAISTSTKLATSTNDVKEYRKLLVTRQEGSLVITWEGSIDSKPDYFCQNETCKDEIFIDPQSKLINFDFMPGRGDLIIMSEVSGIYVSEIDDRSLQNVQKLFDGPNVDFRINDSGNIFFKKDNKFYSIAL